MWPDSYKTDMTDTWEMRYDNKGNCYIHRPNIHHHDVEVEDDVDVDCDNTDGEELDWGREMSKLLWENDEKFMKSPYANKPVQKPKAYEEVSGHKRKVFILND